MTRLHVSLSSIPPRFDRIGATLESLLAQRDPPDRIEVWIPARYDRFPGWDGTLPAVPRGVSVQRCGKDMGPATKILPAAQRYADEDVDLLFCDDDRIYAPDWTQRFRAARRAHPDAALAMRGMMAAPMAGTAPAADRRQPEARLRKTWTDPGWQLRRAWAALRRRPEPERRRFRRSGYIDIFEGCAGVMVKPWMFGKEDWRIPAFARPVDDIWLSGCLARRGVPIWLIANTMNPANTAARDAAPLSEEINDGRDRWDLNGAVVRHLQDTFGVWV